MGRWDFPEFSTLSGPNYTDCIKRMSTFGLSLIGIGLIWGWVFPINKPLWTSSYVLFTGGIAILVLAALTYIIDIINIVHYY